MSLDLEAIKARHSRFASADLDHEGTVLAISAATDVPFLLAEVESLREERDEAKERVIAFHGHSVLLNSVTYRISEALAQTKGAEEYLGNPIEDVERLIAERDEARAAIERLTYERDQRIAESERLGETAQRLVRRATEERERANEAARLSAEARDAADDLRKTIGDLAEAIADLERQRMDRDAWAVRVCTEHKLYALPLEVEEEFGAIDAAFGAYRRDMAAYREFGDKSVVERERAITERDALAEQVARVRALHSAHTRIDMIGVQCRGCRIEGVAAAVRFDHCRTLAALDAPAVPETGGAS
jgi:chromosome segregation ATPase